MSEGPGGGQEAGAVGGGFRTWVPYLGSVGDNRGPSTPPPPTPGNHRYERRREGQGKKTIKGREESRGLKLLTRRYPATQGRRIYHWDLARSGMNCILLRTILVG